MKKILLVLLKTGILTWLIALSLWTIISGFYEPYIFPSPLATLHGASELIEDGSLFYFMLVSFSRVISGWILGSLIAIPIGILMGRVEWVRLLISPLLHFIRFIPAIAFITLFLLWFGMGETAKVALITYATLFIVIINTMTGVLLVSEDRLRSVRSMGATEWQIIRYVILPSSIPYIYTGVRLAMGASYMAIIGAEMVASNEGVGFLIWNARMYFKTEWIFVGLICLGLMGFLTDKIIVAIGRRFLNKYNVK